MQRALQNVAAVDTPSTVSVPSSWSGLALWAIGRFGGIMLATMFLAYAWNDSNEAHKKQTERLISLLEARAARDVELTSALNDFSKVLEHIREEALSAHRMAK